eukprot:TRINITY_DN8047_c0_g1_i1.p1 TRINITY_DN8047_c0_g1~~TRINITY_DN8047_c0_g1_i1.p1  ORF type:complete len:614 (+),score=221.70 TRINITY_DN8047_c0_g1_i1:184-2025(+)
MARSVLAGVRQMMKEHNLAAYYVPSADPHDSEYPAECFRRVLAVSEFSGSAGTAVVTPSEALLWTDGRYWLQAQKEMSSAWTLMKMRQDGVKTVDEWFGALPSKARIGYDPAVMTPANYELFTEALKDNGAELVGVETNLVDQSWQDRPAFPHSTVFVLDEQYAGKPATEKIADVVADLDTRNADAAVFSALDEIAWLLNLRGHDTECTPVFLSYAILVKATKRVHLFTDMSRVPDDVQKRVADFADIHPYEDFFKMLKKGVGARVVFDPRTANCAIVDALEAGKSKGVRSQSSVQIAKAVKNPTELQGIITCHVRDGLALSRFLQWVEGAVMGGEKVDECQAADKLESFRRAQDKFFSLSFPSISSSGPNGAVIHYRPYPETARLLSQDELYLIDSGGQYYDGTTDVTRTIAFGTPKAREVEAYTLVLKGVIAINTMVFPEGTLGSRFDSFARYHLWQHGLDFGHGTGHGVGHFLGVHEGPHSISIASTANSKPMKEANIVSNEPGFYLDGHFGIRIENLERVVKRATNHQFQGKQFYTFDTLTLAPLDSKLIDTDLLTAEEIAWVDAYHMKVVTELSRLTADAGFLQWLKAKCAPLGKAEPVAKKRKTTTG